MIWLMVSGAKGALNRPSVHIIIGGDRVTKIEQQERARRRYIRRVDRAQYHNDLVDAASEYITALEEIIKRYIRAETIS